MVISLSDLARLVNGQLHGDGDVQINGADIIRDACPDHITFVENDKLAGKMSTCKAAAAVVPEDSSSIQWPRIGKVDCEGSEPMSSAAQAIVGRM